nr:VTC domain-containing protein [Verrucomicrobiota bacterium]
MTSTDAMLAAPDTAAPTEYELKLVLPEGMAPAVATWLGSVCRPHPQFHDAIITSVYYDDPEWSLLGEKLNSDFLKRKLRLRWYRTPGRPRSESPAFIEGKFKVGGRREKLRIPLDTPVEELEHTPLDTALFHRPLELLQAQG